MKKRKCAKCGADITNKNYAQVVDKGVIVRICTECDRMLTRYRVREVKK